MGSSPSAMGDGFLLPGFRAVVERQLAQHGTLACLMHGVGPRLVVSPLTVVTTATTCPPILRPQSRQVLLTWYLLMGIRSCLVVLQGNCAVATVRSHGNPEGISRWWLTRVPEAAGRGNSGHRREKRNRPSRGQWWPASPLISDD